MNIIQSNELYDEILDLVKATKMGNIQCIGVAGRHSWSPVLSKLLDKRSDESLHEANEFNIEIAYISPEFCKDNMSILEKFETVVPILEDIKRAQKQLEAQYPNDKKKRISLYNYDHLPNFVGFLVNDNYLFLNICFWEKLDTTDELDFRGGGTDYLVYDLNDKFGGSMYIERFRGWFNFIKKNHKNEV